MLAASNSHTFYEVFLLIGAVLFLLAAILFFPTTPPPRHGNKAPSVQALGLMFFAGAFLLQTWIH